MTILYLLFALAAALGFYLAAPQRSLWPAADRYRQRLLAAAWLCAALSLATAAAALGFWPGVFTGLTAVMTASVCVPYFAAYWGKKYAG